MNLNGDIFDQAGDLSGNSYLPKKSRNNTDIDYDDIHSNNTIKQMRGRYDGSNPAQKPPS